MSLQKAVQEKFGVKPTIKTGKRGDMTVFLNDKSIFGYKAEGSMPPVPDLLRRIEESRA